MAINDLVVINTSVPHAETSQNGSPMEYVVLGVEGLEPLTGIGGYALMHLLGEQEMVSTCLRLMVQEAREGQPGWEDVCQNLLEVLLISMLRSGSLSVVPDNSRLLNRECTQIKNYLDANYSETITLDSLAALTHMNKYYLAHTFTKYVGLSPINYLLQKRIQEGKSLLESTSYSIAQISDLLGFSSQSLFSQAFRKATGMTPMQYIISVRIENAQRLLCTQDYNVTEVAAIVGYDNPLYFSRLFKKQIGLSPTDYRKNL